MSNTIETPTQPVQTLNLLKEIFIEAPLEIVWESVVAEWAELTNEDGTPMPMKLEAWPGGRLYRELGDNAGHLWGHVQVIKPPKLLELWGPLFMSYPAVNHVQYRLSEENGTTRLKLTHRAIGLISPEHARGVEEGWQGMLDLIRKIAARKVEQKR